jgi:hypothetical protein
MTEANTREGNIREHDDAVLVGLRALDADIRKATGGGPGTGIFSLLDMAANQFLGVPRGSYPIAPPAPAKAFPDPIAPPAPAKAFPDPIPAAKEPEPAKEQPKHEPSKPAAHAPAPNRR